MMGRLRGSKEEEREWRDVIKLGSKLGDREDIKRRKELVTIALAKNDIIWKKKWKTKLTTRIKLYETLVKSVLLYNYGTWGVSKDDQRKLKPAEKSCWDPVATKYLMRSGIRSQEQNHFQLRSQKGD